MKGRCTALESIQPLHNAYLGVCVPPGQTAGRDAVRAPSSNAELKQTCSSSYTFSTPITLHAVMLSLRTKATLPLS